MAEQSIVPPEVEALRGKEFTWKASEEVGKSNIRLFALSINHMDPLFFDQDTAGKSKYGGIVAPPTFICETWQYRSMDVDTAGYPSDWLEIPVGRVVRAGNEYEFFEPLRPEDVLSVRMRVSDIIGREGKSGPMIFVTFEYEYKNQDGKLLAKHRETMVSLIKHESF